MSDDKTPPDIFSIAEIEPMENYCEETTCAGCGKRIPHGVQGVVVRRPFNDFYCSNDCAREAVKEYGDRLKEL